MGINLTNIIANPPAPTWDNFILIIYNSAFLFVMVLLLTGFIYRKLYYGIPALIYIAITAFWNRAWELWSKGFCAFIIFLAGLFGYHLTPTQITAYFSIPIVLNFALGLYIGYRPDAIVKIVGRYRFVNSYPVVEWYGLLRHRILLMPQTKSVRSVFRNKANKNVYICGSSGSGKTYASNSLLTRAFKDKPILALSFKPGDITLNLSNFTVVDVSKVPINAFEDEDTFIRAFLITFPVEKVGIMASSVPAILREALRNSRSWSDLIDNLESLADATEDAIRRSTIDWILNNVRWSLKPDIDSSDGWIWDFKTNVVLDFSNLNEEQKTFFAELILNMIWKRLQRERRECVIFIDEAHRILGRKTIYRSVLNEMAREIRSFGGILVVASQNLTDIDKDVLNQFDTQFVFFTTKKEDLDAIRAINPYLVDVVTELPPYVCIDIKQRSKTVELYEFLSPKYEKEPEYLEKPSESSGKVVLDKTYIPDPEFDAKVEKAILDYLAKFEIGYVTRMAKDLSPVLGKDYSRLKFDISRIFKRLVARGIVSKSEFINENGIRIVYYWLKDKGESPFHRILVSSTCKVLSMNNISYDISNEPDLIAHIDNRRIAIECETGLKEDLNTYRRQIVRRLRQGYDEVWTICPTPKIAERYREIDIPNHKVFTLSELRKSLNYK